MPLKCEKSEKESAALPEIAAPLLQWYGQHARVLPWRENKDPYRVWVSEIMLQQTRVEAVKPYYERFLSALPNIRALAEAPEEQLLKLWEGLGYYSRVRNLQKAAKVVTEKYGGALPADFAQLKELPGIGEYTAGAIASIAFDIAVPVVDGNVLRVTARMAGSLEQIDSAAYRSKTRKILEQIIPHEAPGDFNQALMELGATVCLPNGEPLCRHCPVQGICVAKKRGLTAQIPVRAPKKEKRQEQRTVLLLWRRGKIALVRRPKRGLLAGMWEFPCLLGWPEEQEIVGQIKKAGGEVGKIQKLPNSRHIFTHIIWQMAAYEIELGCMPKWEGLRLWAPEELLEQAALPSAYQQYTKLLRQRMQASEKERG